jgi:hypothetical protein
MPTIDPERLKRYQWDQDSLTVASVGTGEEVKLDQPKEAKKDDQAKDQAIFSNSLDVMLDEE